MKTGLQVPGWLTGRHKIRPNSKDGRGFTGDATGALLLPYSLDWNPLVLLDKSRDHGFSLTSSFVFKVRRRQESEARAFSARATRFLASFLQEIRVHIARTSRQHFFKDLSTSRVCTVLRVASRGENLKLKVILTGAFETFPGLVCDSG